MKIVTASEMSRIEKLAIQRGASEEQFMERAGQAVAHCAEEYISLHDLSHSVILLVGKGNNAGDAYVAGSVLQGKGFHVRAISIYPKDAYSPLCKHMADRFERQGGRIDFHTLEWGSDGLIIDGLVGTGFQGRAEGILAEAIHGANSSRLPILAIDIPSGLNGSTGEAGEKVIHATMTLFLGLPKTYSDPRKGRRSQCCRLQNLRPLNGNPQ